MKITFQLLKIIVAVLTFVFMVCVGAVRLFFAVLGALHTERDDHDRTSMEHFMRLPHAYNTDATSGHHDTLRYDDYLDRQ